MELKITNVGRISSAEVEINGITIIAGLNATGKSTVSRSLFAMFHSFSRLSRKVNLEKKYAIKNVILPSRVIDAVDIILGVNEEGINELSALLVGKLDKDIIEKNIIEKKVIINGVPQENIRELSDEIIRINSTSDDLLKKEIISEIFNDEFNAHITNVRSDSGSEIELKIKDFSNKVIFDKNNELLDIKGENELSYEVIYIDDPFIIDSYNLGTERPRQVIFSFSGEGEKTTNHRASLIAQYKNAKNLTLVDKANLKEKLSLIYKKINDTLGSDMALFEANKNAESTSLSADRLPLDCLSSGMKTFYLIKSLIDNGAIVQNGTLILDEPEVHLHPDWQVTLAEIMVLLQKEMKLHILINTHSPYFLRAIDVYSQKYETKSCVKYYLSYNEENISKIRDVTFNVSEIYKVLSKPLQRIENEGYNE